MSIDIKVILREKHFPGKYW